MRAISSNSALIYRSKWPLLHCYSFHFLGFLSLTSPCLSLRSSLKTCVIVGADRRAINYSNSQSCSAGRVCCKVAIRNGVSGISATNQCPYKKPSSRGLLGTVCGTACPSLSTLLPLFSFIYSSLCPETGIPDVGGKIDY